MKNKKKILLAVFVAVLLSACWFVWSKWASPTRIALVNFPNYQVSNIALSNSDSFIKFVDVPLEEIDKLDGYDFVLTWGMGLRINDEQRETFLKIAEKVPTHFISVTSPENDITSLSETQLEEVDAYLNSANKKNYQNFARYVRTKINGKKLFATAPEKPAKSIGDAFFYLGEDNHFPTLKDFEAFLKKEKIYKEGKPKVAFITGIHDPFSGNRQHIDSIIVSLEKSGLNVYPFASFGKRIDFLKEINPDAVIYMPHGRVQMMDPEVTVEYLKEKNIPLFTPISIIQLEEEWKKNPMGMFGGFMGQTIVMPELDGALYPYALIAQEKSKDGFYMFKAMPERLKTFTQVVNNYLRLKEKQNAEKKVAIYYFKGYGENPLVAQGLETNASLYNFLKRLKAEGYTVDDLPATEEEFEKVLNLKGNIFLSSAQGAFDEYVKNGDPELVETTQYEKWLKGALSKDLYKKVMEKNGAAPYSYMGVTKDGKNYLAVSRVKFGNVVILPQPPAGISSDDQFKVAHGAKEIPPHAYIGTYLWTQHGFKADAMIHFGTHGSLEFTPHKQVALDGDDWGDICIGAVPHFYYYTIANVGESIMAKRRTYASLVSYLNPAFTESDTRTAFNSLMDKINYYYKAKEEDHKRDLSLKIKADAVKMGFHRSLRLDSVLTKPYTEEDIDKLENFAEEIATEKINGQFYTMGEPYSSDKIQSTVLAMSTDPLAYSVAALDKLRGKVTDQQLKRKVFFTENYLNPAKNLVNQILAGREVTPELVAQVAGVPVSEIEKSREILTPKREMPFFLKKSMEKKGKGSAELSDIEKQLKAGKIPEGMPEFVAKKLMEKVKRGERLEPYNPGGKRTVKKGEAKTETKKPEIPKEVKEKAIAVLDIERTLKAVVDNKKALLESPEIEFKSFINALNGGYTPPSSGGDLVANPRAVPTGRNMYSVNAEMTPSELSWDRGVTLAKATIEEYKKKHKGAYPKKVAYTFWSSEFIETEGVSIAQALYMLGVEPVRDSFGRVVDVRLIPSKELGRPRIDVVIQTSGQFRDLAASRLFLLTKAVEMAANAKDDEFDNQVSAGTIEIEKQLVKAGVPPKRAREMSNYRIFGGQQGRYDTGTKEMMLSGDKWESTQDIAKTYIHNMGALYGSEKEWSQHEEGMFRAALSNTDVLIQPRQNNTWGALSLDHVFEFMGGMNAAIKDVTGKDPDAYLADYRNHKNMRMQELKEAVGVEAQATIFNPKYIKEMMKGKSSSAGQIAEIATNMFGWEATRPEVVDDAMWEELYQTYVEDKHNLGIKDFIHQKNSASLQTVTAVMLEATRKGMWKADAGKIAKLAMMHNDLVKENGAESSDFSAKNVKLQNYIAKKLPEAQATEYKGSLEKMKSGTTQVKDGKVLKKEENNTEQLKEKVSLNGLFIGGGILIVFIALLIYFKKKRKSD
ncbi:MAG: cobaltochelatase subunit CobN [Bergeyella cardium]